MSDVRLTEAEREALNGACIADYERGWSGLWPERTNLDVAVERILAARLADRDAAGVEARVRALHKPEPVYWEAFHCPMPDEHARHHVEGRYSNDDICTACPPLRQTCSTCVEYGEHGAEPLRWPCPTLAALSGPADEHPADGTAT